MEKDYTEVYYYLKLTEFYLSGDLKEIKSISKKAEDTDILHNIPHRFSISGLYPQFEMKAGLNFENPESAIFRLTLPIASALFATLDFLGYLIGDNDDATKTYINFPEFFKYARKLNFNISDEEVDIINSVFRQG